MAKGIFQDKSTHYTNNYIVKLLVKSRLFSEVLLNVRLTFYDTEHKISISVSFNFPWSYLKFSITHQWEKWSFLIRDENAGNLSSQVDHNNIIYAVLARHLISNVDLYETYIEYVYNNSAAYYLNNRLDLQKKEIQAELHLDK